jgi:antirestriction protein
MSKIYVGTYGKYNAGSIKGEWLDLEDYNSKQEFIDACYKLHPDEHDPEFMFQDWEEIPDKYIAESSIDEALWDWLKLPEHEREIASIYFNDVDQSAEPEQAIEAYEGEYDSEEDWAREFWESTGMAGEIPKFAQNYIDYKSYAHDAQIGGDMTFVNKGVKVKAFRR